MSIFSSSPSTYDIIMSPNKMNALESSRPRKVSTQTVTRKQRKAFKQRKIPKALEKVPLYIYGAKMDDFINGDATIKPPVVSESPAFSSLHVTNPQDAVNLDSYFPPANFAHSQIPVSTRVYRGAEPSHVPIPFQYGPNFNNQPEDNILSLTNTGNPCQSCGRCDPPSSSTGSLSMECGADPYQQLPDSNTQYFIPQPILPYVSNGPSSFPCSSYDIYAEITGSSHLTMTSANDGTTLPFPNFDANSSYYM